ncbi:MAG: TolC family protein [Cyclobacteriaceae bacterium]|nr:TolC family protein [Cyclobacteriaceae bacterium]
MINQLIFDASKAYWQWYAAWHIYQTYVESVMLAEERFEGLKMSFEQGDIPAIDTLEAYILVQNREVSKSEAQVGLIQARYELSNYLWSEDLQPLLLQENSKPVDQIVGQTDEAAISGWSEAEQMNAVHPLIRLYANKVEMLDFDRRMKAEKIKPKLNINYNVLNEPIGGDPSTNFSTNNYKWGFEFSMPLLLRQERGALQLAKLKILDANLALQQKSTEIFNKISAYQAEITLLEEQMKIYGKAVENYQALLQGERRKFEEGESSVFLINSRESSLISADVKLISLQGKYQKAKAGLVMAMGGLAATIP